MLSALRNARGFTLVEFMVGLLVMGILTALAAPSFRAWVQNVQVRNAAESILNGLQLARSEAVHQNTMVRFNLNDASGLMDWEICAPGPAAAAATPCPANANIIQRGVSQEGMTNARIGVYRWLDGQPQANFTLAIAAGNELPTHVTFNGLGRTVNDGPDNTARIDVTNAAEPNARRMVVVVDNPGGQVRMCDPALTASNPADPQAC